MSESQGHQPFNQGQASIPHGPMQSPPLRTGPQTTLPPTSRIISSPTGLPRTAAPGVRPPSATPTILPPKPVEHIIEEPIELVEEELANVPTTPISKIHGITSAGHAHFDEHWKRTPSKSNTGAIRVRSFYGRLSDQGLGFLDHSINDWLDKNPDVEIKNVTSTVGLFEGKMKELALILNLWY